MSKIREVRKRKNVTQEELSKKLGINRTTLSKYENGLISPSLATMKRIANALGVRIDDLLEIEGFDTGEEFEKRRAEILNSTPQEEIAVVHAGTPGAMLKQIWSEMNENGHEKVAGYAADILPTHRK